MNAPCSAATPGFFYAGKLPVDYAPYIAISNKEVFFILSLLASARIKLLVTEQMVINGADHGGQTLFSTRRGVAGVVADGGQRTGGRRDRRLPNLSGARQNSAGGKQFCQTVRRQGRLA
ncbi:protein of unknown function [Serratia sp. Tan611]|nr:protein of unknown function [Serratia sp. Tan611]